MREIVGHYALYKKELNVYENILFFSCKINPVETEAKEWKWKYNYTTQIIL